MRSMTELIWTQGGILNPVNRPSGTDHRANPADFVTRVEARCHLKGLALAVALNDDVFRLARALLDELDELVGAEQRDLGEHEDLIAGLQPRRLRRTMGFDFLNDRVITRVQIEDL